MNIEDINVRQVPIKLARLNEEIIINPPSVSDEIWFRDVIGEDKLRETLEKMNDIPMLCRIVFKLLSFESKQLIMKYQIVDIDEETGEEVELKSKPYEKLSYLISGSTEIVKIIQALVKAKGLSLPQVKDTEKKTRKKRSVGKRSTTHSATNMDGQ